MKKTLEGEEWDVREKWTKRKHEKMSELNKIECDKRKGYSGDRVKSEMEPRKKERFG